MEPTQADRDALFHTDPMTRNAAFSTVMGATEEPVDWAYDIWDQAVHALSDRDNHIRAVSAQLLCNLAKSDPDKRMLGDFDALLQVTRDPRFVTARHALQNIWKVGVVGPDEGGAADQHSRRALTTWATKEPGCSVRLAGPEQLALLMAGLRIRYTESFAEKNGTLVRFDILVDLANLFERHQDAAIKSSALAWTDEEPDPKYREKYLGIWKPKPAH